MSSPAIKTSPFTFLTWKDDDEAVVASTTNTELGYIQVLSIDGIDIDDIVAHARVTNDGDAGLTTNFAEKFPSYVAAVAAAKGSECFATTGKAKVEYAEMNTGVVNEAEMEATAANFNECVRLDGQRAAHEAAHGGGGGKKKKTQKPKTDGEEEEEDDDDGEDYEDMDDDDDEEEEEDESPKGQAYMAKRRLLDMVSTQMETAFSIAFDMGLTVEDTQAAFRAAVPPLFPVPQTPEECMHAAEENMALKEYLSALSNGGGGGGGQGGLPPGMAGMAGSMPGMPEGMPANCPQQ